MSIHKQRRSTSQFFATVSFAMIFVSFVGTPSSSHAQGSDIALDFSGVSLNGFNANLTLVGICFTELQIFLVEKLSCQQLRKCVDSRN